MENPSTRLNLKQLRAINNPLRLEIHGRLEDEGPASARELAEKMGLDELGLYYHLKILAKVGLIKPVTSRATATKPETVYAAERIQVVGFNLHDPEEAEAVIKHGEVLLNAAAKEYRAAIETFHSDPEHKCSYYRYMLKMSPETRKEFDKRFIKLVHWAISEETDEDVRFIITVATSPMVGRKP